MKAKMKEIGIVVCLENGDVHQVALNQLQLNTLKQFLKIQFFNGENIKILPTVLEGVYFENTSDEI